MAKVAKKVLAILAGDKNGRKFLGYVIGIVLFIVLLPVIAVYGLFGWMAGGGAAEVIDYNVVYEYIPAEQRAAMIPNVLPFKPCLPRTVSVLRISQKQKPFSSHA